MIYSPCRLKCLWMLPRKLHDLRKKNPHLKNTTSSILEGIKLPAHLHRLRGILYESKQCLQPTFTWTMRLELYWTQLRGNSKYFKEMKNDDDHIYRSIVWAYIHVYFLLSCVSIQLDSEKLVHFRGGHFHITNYKSHQAKTPPHVGFLTTYILNLFA